MTNFQSFSFACVIVLLFSLSSCVGKKKYIAALNSISELQNAHDTEIQQWKQLLDKEKSSVQNLNLQLAEKKGESQALKNMQDKMQQRVDELESQIENINNQSQSSEASLNQSISQKDKEIQSLKNQISDIASVLERYKSTYQAISSELSLALQSFTADEQAVEIVNDGVKVVIFEKTIFVKGSASRITSKGQTALSLISPIIQRYPDMTVQVVGHTDNDPPSNKGYKNNWIFSSLRATTVVRALTNDYDVNANQLLAAGKGEFEPRSSNDTKEGKAMNRRIELNFLPNAEALDRAIRKKIN